MQKLNDTITTAFPKGYPVVFLHAHPDDESFLSAGVINELVSQERECILVYGAAAKIKEQPKTQVRQEEAETAAKILGISKLFYLDFCEPQYTSPDARPLATQDAIYIGEQLVTLLAHNQINQPFILVSYDQNGGYGNQDHKKIHAVGRMAQSIHHKMIPILYEVTLNRDYVNTWLKNVQSHLDSNSLPQLSYWVENFGLPASDVSYYYELSEAQIELKIKALAAHTSQIRTQEFPLSLSKKYFADFFGKEWLSTVTYDPQKFYEIERKFLLNKIPFNLSNYAATEIIQGYLAVDNDGNEDRIRQKNNKYTRSFMGGNGLKRIGKEIEISKEEFDRLWPNTEGKRIRKTRYTIPYKNLTIELDIYDEKLDGVITAEIEFPSESAAHKFTPPLWLGTDVTNDQHYKNKNLAS